MLRDNTAESQAMPTQLFLSYARADSALRDRLTTVLEPMRRRGIITLWHDQQINPGEDWKTAIDTRLDGADVVLLLVSPDFLASDSCSEVELRKALKRWSAKEARVVPIIARDCLWDHSLLGGMQAILVEDKPVASIPNQDDAWATVGRAIERLIGETTCVRPKDRVPVAFVRDEQGTAKWRRIALVGIPAAATASALITWLVAHESTRQTDSAVLAAPSPTSSPWLPPSSPLQPAQFGSDLSTTTKAASVLGIWTINLHKTYISEGSPVNRTLDSTLTIEQDGASFKALLVEEVVDEAQDGPPFPCTGTRRATESYKGRWAGTLEGNVLTLTNVSYEVSEESRKCGYAVAKEMKMRLEGQKLAAMTVDGKRDEFTRDYILTRVDK